METQEALKALSYLSNRSLAQTTMLYELCGNFDDLLRFEAYQKKNFRNATPDTKEEVMQAVENWNKSK